MSEIKLTSVKLIKEGEKLEVSYQESGDLQSSVSKEYKNVVHPDLVNAMQGLKIHLAVLSGWIEPSQAKKAKDLEDFRVNGYHIGGKEDHNKCIIVGGRNSPYGYVGVNSPGVLIEGFSEENEYLLLKDLQEKIELIEKETMLYMSGEKQAQPSMFPEVKESATKLQIAKPVEPFPSIEGVAKAIVDETNKKKKGGKRVKQTPENPSGIVPE